MVTHQRVVMDDVLELLGQLAKDWEYSGEINARTQLFEDLGLESLDIVVLGTAIQEKYATVMPFSEFLVEIGQREVKDISVGELVAFVQANLDNPSEDRA